MKLLFDIVGVPVVLLCFSFIALEIGVWMGVLRKGDKQDDED